MSVVEDDLSLRAPNYERPIRFTYDRNLDGGGAFRYAYKNGAVDCSRITQYAQMCRMAPEEMNALGRRRLPFVYMDVGRWGGTEYSFGLVAGPDVYLCEYVPPERATGPRPQTRNASVGELFDELAAQQCGVRVINYAHAENVTKPTITDSHLYLLLPDYHLPPVSWFHPRTTVSALAPSAYRDPPAWFQTTRPYTRNANLYRGLWGLRSAPRSGPPASHPADIFGQAGVHLSTFLGALTTMAAATRSKLHVIAMGDMFELWLDRSYQFDTDGVNPRFRPGGADNAADWTAEVVLANMAVVEAHQALSSAGLAEVKFLWGNHDAYLMDAGVCAQLSMPPRSANYLGLNGDLWVEHGHRFDSSNHDAIKSSDGPFFANAAFYFPSIRKAEPLGRDVVTLMTGSPTERDAYFLGASLLYLNQMFDQGIKPFSVFCMGHTHARHMRTFNITAQYSLYGGTQ
jgi:UDP-2,3-diacylglucosamine pyrophosphatase LpxH